MNWLSKRLDPAAQWEHRQYALSVLQLFEEVMPITAGAFREFVLRQA
jgi:thymidylate synthase ThyX